MPIREEIFQYYISPDRQMLSSYQQLSEYRLDIGFITTMKNGKDFHQITRDIVISVNQFTKNRMTNLCFTDGKPIRLELNDAELNSFYADYIELKCVLSGHLEMEIEGETAFFEENDICFINPMSFHREIISSSNCMLLNISIDRDVFTEAFLKTIELNALQRFLRESILQIGEKQHYIRFSPTTEVVVATLQQYLSTILFEEKNHLPGYVDITKGYIIRLMDLLANNYQYNFNRRDTRLYNEKLFETVTEFITAHLDTIVMADLTEAFHFQPNYFNNLIKKFTGMTYSNYLISLRIKRAKYLLASTGLPIDEVMWMIGYNNKGFFYKKFQEAVGMSPKEYRLSKAQQSGANANVV